MKKLLEETGTTLYRGTGLTQKELQTYKALIGKVVRDKYGFLEDGYMALTGFISTSMKREVVEQFVWSDQDHQATLFQILWKRQGDYYLMDMSAFPDEQEVLLVDGSKFEVMSVETTQKNGKPFNTVNT